MNNTRKFIYSFVLFFAMFAYSKINSSDKTYFIFLDIDETIATKLDDGFNSDSALAERLFDKVITVEYTVVKKSKNGLKEVNYKEKYGIRKNTLQFLNFLANQADVNVGFFSGGLKERNEALLKSLMLSPVISAYDLAVEKNKSSNQFETRIFNREDLTVVENIARKDFSKISLVELEPDLSNLILIDDNPQVVREENNFNLLKASPIVTSLSSIRGLLKRYTHSNEDKKKLKYFLYLIESDISRWVFLLNNALNVARTTNQSFVEALSNLEIYDESAFRRYFNNNLFDEHMTLFKSYLKLGRSLLNSVSKTKNYCSSIFN